MTDIEESNSGRPLDAGWFGENLRVWGLGSRVSGLGVSGARVGERWMIGPTVIVEVTSPREPCSTFARWVGGPDERGWVKRFAAARHTGLYLRVEKAGVIVAGDTMEVIEVPATRRRSPRSSPELLRRPPD